MEIKELIAITRDPHFLRFVALLSVPQAPGWRMQHPRVPSVRGTLDRLMKLSKDLDSRPIQEQFINEFTGMLVWIVEADEHLGYDTEDMEWFVECIDHPGASTIFSLLFAYASCPVRWFSAEQVAEFTGKSASTWQKRAADGQIIGAKKLGKTWLFPESGLAAFGVKLPPPMQMEIEEVSEDS